MKTNKMIKGTFISVWENNNVISTPAELNENTGEIFAESVNVEDLGILKHEKFIDIYDNEYEVCIECHSFILKTVMKKGFGKSLYEANVCPNKNCDSHL